MGRTVLDAVVGWIGGLEDAPAENTADALQVAAKLEAAPPEHADGDFDAAPRGRDRGRSQHVRVQRARVPRLHPRRRSVHGRARGVPGASAQSVRRLVAAEPGDRPDRRERDPVDVLALRLPGRDVAGPPHDRRFARQPLRVRDRATREAGRGLPRRYVLLHRSDACEQHEGGDDRRVLPAQPPPRPDRRGTSDGSRRPPLDGPRRPRGGPPSVPRDPGRRHDEHRRGRSPRRRRRRRGGRSVVDARRRRLRRLLPAHRSGPGAVPRDRAGRQRHAGSRTRDSSCPTGRAVWSCGTGPRSATRTTRAPPTSRTCRRRATLPNYNEYSPELSRDNRGFRVWFPLALHGVAAFREALDEKLDLTDRLHRALVGRSQPGDRVGPAAHRRPVPPPSGATTARTASCWRGSTRPSACSCRAR